MQEITIVGKWSDVSHRCCANSKLQYPIFVTVRFIFLISFCLWAVLSSAQLRLQAGAGIGRVIKHKDGLTFNIPAQATHQTLSCHHRVSGAKAWHHYWGMPSIAHMYERVNYGDDRVLGTAHTLMRGLDMTIARRGSWRLEGQMYTGIAMLTRTFDYLDNPTNNAVGSILNNATRLGLAASVGLGSGWRLGLRSHLLHISNGLTSYPNSGINSWGAALYTSYDILRRQATLQRQPTTADTISRRWVVDLQLHYGRTEHAIPNGPKYAHYLWSAGVGYRYHSLLTLLLGVDHEYKERTYLFYLRDLSPEEEARARAQRLSIWLAHEFLFNRIILRPQIGLYTNAYWPRTDNYYVKIGLHYRVPLVSSSSMTIGIVLKAHQAVADHLSLVVGLRI